MSAYRKLSPDQVSLIELVSANLGEREFDLVLQRILNEHLGPFCVSGRDGVRISQAELSCSPWEALSNRLSKYHLSSGPIDVCGEKIQEIDPDVMDEIIEGLRRILDAIRGNSDPAPVQPAKSFTLSHDLTM
ncbi:TPA: hypothetical protein ACRXTJ_001300 [Pseudomonas aeruginosa]|uniref:hypothetical protein n=1 Tax=Pseudomonas aeruginosa TaxID=287 RepID=UPI000DE6987E|nr:hypothetical protein [Pseudomonas aeruginosa]MZY25998.1 hypothetical protein [Pseudomonas aeruginosa]SST89524.1 Uncharacterised protein [Acinetobacter baumannii]HCG0238991.1 hypothetical protein [Pseudomonas aeruginosa]